VQLSGGCSTLAGCWAGTHRRLREGKHQEGKVDIGHGGVHKLIGAGQQHLLNLRRRGRKEWRSRRSPVVCRGHCCGARGGWSACMSDGQAVAVGQEWQMGLQGSDGMCHALTAVGGRWVTCGVRAHVLATAQVDRCSGSHA